MKSLLMGMLLSVSAPALAADPIMVSKRQAADGSHVLVHEVLVNAPVAVVWKTISTADGWKTWAAPAAWILPNAPDVIETSYSPRARPGGAATIKQQIIARVPEVLMIFRTVKAPSGFPDLDTYTKVVSVLQVEPAGQGTTKVRLTGAGYADTDAGRRLLGFFEKGNAITLEGLRRRFADEPVGPAKRGARGE